MKNTNKANYFFQSRVDLKPRKESIDRINDYHSVLSAFIFLGEENKLKVSEINDALKSLKNGPEINNAGKRHIKMALKLKNLLLEIISI